MMGVLTARLPLLHHLAGSTGALRHSNPPVTSEDQEGGGGQVVSQEVSLLGSKCGKAEVQHEKVFSFRSCINIRSVAMLNSDASGASKTVTQQQKEPCAG